MSDLKALSLIAGLVPPGSRVLDLGCGSGELLALLRRKRGCSGYGIEIDPDQIGTCVRKGVPVIQRNLEEGLAMFEDSSFDVVLQIDTLQHIRHTVQMLAETVRVGRIGIIAFPNFAHWPHRLSILRGTMPVSPSLPYQWFDTPNIRVGTLRDFSILAARCGLEVTESFGIHAGKRVDFLPNLLASTAVFKVRKP
jgi:methionine biosynthesis protein MetW